MGELSGTIEKLCAASIRDYANPYELLESPESLDRHQWFFSPELISLFGTDLYESLSEEQRQALSFHEAVNFFSLNIHGERALIEGLARRLYKRDNQDLAPYLHHFLDEENKHMTYFGGFCMKYAQKIYPDRKLTLQTAEYEPGEEDFLFFAKVLIFEEIVDVYNMRMATDDRLNALARKINLLHHKDEARHLVFGRQLVKELFAKYSPKWSEQTLEKLRDYLVNYIKATWSEYYNPDVYRDAGLTDPYEAREQAMSSKHTMELQDKITKGWLQGIPAL